MLNIADLKLGEEPEVGTNYLVPCLDLRKADLGTEFVLHFGNFKSNMVAIPVLGSAHKDPEFRSSGGEDLHYHLDIRFITEAEFKAWGVPESRANSSTYFQFPIVTLKYAKETPKTYLHPKMCLRRLANFSHIHLGQGYDYNDFEDEMEKHTLKLDNPICPHHGTSLKSQCVRDGKVVCPLHGAVWDATTGRLVRKTNKRTQEQIKQEKEARRNLASIK